MSTDSDGTQEDSPSLVPFLGRTAAFFGAAIAFLTAPVGLVGLPALAYAGFVGACTAATMWLGGIIAGVVGLFWGQIAYVRAQERSPETGLTQEEAEQKESESMALRGLALGCLGAFAGACIGYSLSKDWILTARPHKNETAQSVSADVQPRSEPRLSR